MNLKIRAPGLGGDSIKALRGLSLFNFDVGIEQIRRVVAFEGEKLKPGEEIPVSVQLANLPRNASVQKIKGTIEVQKDDDAETPSISQKSVIKEGTTQKTFNVDIDMPSLPRNIEVKLEGGDVFWSFAADPVQGSYELAGFEEQVNDYLDRLASEGAEIRLKFLVKADGPGEVKIDIDTVDYSVIQTQSWGNPLDNTIRLDRTFQLAFGGIERVPLDPLTEQGSTTMSLAAVTFDITGEFGPERLLTTIEQHDGKEFAMVSGDCAVAQAISFPRPLSEKSIRCVGVAGLFEADFDAELYIEMQTDAAGSVAAGPPSAKSNLPLAAPEADGAGRWSFAAFDQPVDLAPETQYWVVIRGIRGKARLGFQTQAEEYLKQAMFNRGGRLWKPFSHGSSARASALLRLVYLPEIDNQSAAIEIAIEGTQVAERLDPQSQTETITMDITRRAEPSAAVLVIKSHARGTLSIANVIQEYLPKGAAKVFKLQPGTTRQPKKQ